MKPITNLGTIYSWMNPHLEVRSAEDRGQGVFAKHPIKKQERLAIFGGDIMLIDELKTIPVEFQMYALQIEERFVMGMRRPTQSESTDYFNPSCNPNAGIRGQIFLVAMRDIAEDEEVTFDYAMVVSESENSDLVFSMDCMCGTDQCRKTITENDWKFESLQKKYAGYFSQYLQEKINGA